ncbi:hypothetical protein J3B02_006032, partial [Coemansia erecta]
KSVDNSTSINATTSITSATPSHPIRGGGRSISEAGQTEQQYSTIMKEQAQKHIRNYLRTDVKGVLELALPVNAGKRQAAENTIKRAIKNLGPLFKKFDEAAKQQYPLTSNQQSSQPSLGSESSIKDILVKEKDSYEPLTSFIIKVAKAVQKNSKTASRLILPYKRTDTAIVNGETRSRVDIAFRCRDVKGEAKIFERTFNSSACDKKQREIEDKLYYEDVFALIEVKRVASTSEQASAFEQLVRYTREIYDKQHNRRFAWGLTICGFDMRICIFGANYILASDKFDLKTYDGKEQFIRLLVYWSFCEEHRLGYDPSIRRLKDLGCWEIDVPKLDESESTSSLKKSADFETFYSNTVIVSADRQFGRLTR